MRVRTAEPHVDISVKRDARGRVALAVEDLRRFISLEAILDGDTMEELLRILKQVKGDGHDGLTRTD